MWRQSIRSRIYDEFFVGSVNGLDITGAMDLAYNLLDAWGDSKVIRLDRFLGIGNNKHLSLGEKRALEIAVVYRDLALVIGKRNYGFEKKGEGQGLVLRFVEGLLGSYGFSFEHIYLVRDLIEFSGEPFSTQVSGLGRELIKLDGCPRSRLAISRSRRRILDNYFENP